MKSVFATLAVAILSMPAISADPEKPVELTAAEITKLYSDKPADREEVWKKYDGKLLKLKGQVLNDGLTLYTSSTPKQVTRIGLRYALAACLK